MSIKSSAQNAVAHLYQARYNVIRKRELARPGRKPVILFTSVSRAELGSNMLCVHNKLLERGLNAEHEILLDLHASIKEAQHIGAQLAFIDKLARADVVFCDDYHPFLYFIDYPSDVKIIQLWHAVGSFKTIGFARNRADAAERKRTSRAHRSYTHVIVSAECDRPHYAEAFGLPIDRIYATGIPRIDAIMDPDWQRVARASFFERHPEAVGKRVVLFAPTFRGDDVRHASYDFSKLDYDVFATWCRAKNAVAILKFHPFTQGLPAISPEQADVLLDASEVREVNDLLPAVDMLVTDYSSVIYEASLLGIPMVFYAYDLAEYEQGRGFFEPYRSFVPGPIVADFDELLAALSGEPQLQAVEDFKARHFAHLDTCSTDRVVDLALGPES